MSQKPIVPPNITLQECDVVDAAIYICLNTSMLTNADKQTIQEIFDKRIDRVEIKIDKVLKIVTRSDQEHILTKAIFA